jgi:adenylate cyclase
VLFGVVLDVEDRKLTSARLVKPGYPNHPTTRCSGPGKPVMSPDRDSLPGVYIHATAVNNILQNKGLIEFGWTTMLAATFSLGMSGALLAFARSLVLGGFGLLVALIVWTGVAVYGFTFSYALPLVDPLLASAISWLAMFTYRFLIADRDKRFLRKSFSSYVSPNLVEVIVNDPDGSAVKTRRQECSFLFTDLAGFTSLVESTDPEVLQPILNDYLDGMTAILFKHEGTLEKIIGDAVNAMFSAPVEQHDHAQRALDCALEMDAWSRGFVTSLREKGISLGKTRIGVNSGMVVVGRFGGSGISDYRALGDPINTAARLESVNKQLGTNVCISGATIEQCSGFTGRPVGNLVLKGQTVGTEVFEPLTEELLNSPMIKAYLHAYNLMSEKNSTASEAFTIANEVYPDDPLIAFHLKRLENGETGTTIIMRDK